MKLTTRITNGMVALGVTLMAGILGPDVEAQTQPGKAVVRAVNGSAVYSIAGQPAVPLKVGTVLGQGAVLKTDKDSWVDLFLGKTAGVVRLTENTTLSLDKLALTDSGADTVVDIQMNLPEGTMLFNVNKLSAASRYEIKVPNGVAGIRGTGGRVSSTGFIVLRDGRLAFVYVPPTGNPVPYTLVAPPIVYFTPLEGVKLAPPELVREINNQFKGLLRPEMEREVPPPKIKSMEPFLSPNAGEKR